MKLSRFAFLTILVLLATVSLWAQTNQGIITGTVTDSTGGAVPEAKVVATNTATNVTFTTQTTSTGDFTIPTVQVGNYQLRVEKTGFKSAVRSGITVSSG